LRRPARETDAGLAALCSSLSYSQHWIPLSAADQKRSWGGSRARAEKLWKAAEVAIFKLAKVDGTSHPLAPATSSAALLAFRETSANMKALRQNAAALLGARMAWASELPVLPKPRAAPRLYPRSFKLPQKQGAPWCFCQPQSFGEAFPPNEADRCLGVSAA